MTPPVFQIYFDWDKHIRWPTPPDPDAPTRYYGYSARQGQVLRAILYHSDEHKVGETFRDTLRFGRDNPDVSWHYSVGEDGEIQRLLDPGYWIAWHAGYSLYAGLREWNDFAVGIELRHRAGQGPYPAVQLDAARWLTDQLTQDHPTIKRAALHRWVACNPYEEQPPVIYGRKTDPTDFSDANFRQWVSTFGQALHI